MSMSTFDALMKTAMQHFPESSLGEDAEGQIVIYTNLRELPDGRVESLDQPDVQMKPIGKNHCVVDARMPVRIEVSSDEGVLLVHVYDLDHLEEPLGAFDASIGTNTPWSYIFAEEGSF